jgi:hypothetical protein
MSAVEQAYATSQNAAHELTEETKRLLADRDGDRLGAFRVTASTYTDVLERHAKAYGEGGLRHSCAYSGRVIAALIMQVIELEQITTGLSARATAEQA